MTSILTGLNRGAISSILGRIAVSNTKPRSGFTIKHDWCVLNLSIFVTQIPEIYGY
jgi:hypothetical protein